jgi:hypothetical protein
MSSLTLLEWPKPLAKLKDVTEEKLQRFKALFVLAVTFQLMYGHYISIGLIII